MFDAIFEFFFKFRPLMFEQGDFAFRASWLGGLAALAAIAASVVTWRSYTQVRGNSQPIHRLILTVVRLAAFAVLAFCLMQPVLILSSVVPQQNFLGVLIDESRSMRIADTDETPRLQFVQEQLASTDAPLRAALNERFSLRFFGFASETDRLDVVNELTYDGTRTHLGQALGRAHDELSDVPLSGLVVVTDGADNAAEGLAESLLPVQAAGVPVFTVGLGREEFDRDIQLGRVDTPRRVLRGASLVTDVVVSHRGYEGERVTVQVEDEGRIVGSEDVTLGDDDDPARPSVSALPPGRRGRGCSPSGSPPSRARW